MFDPQVAFKAIPSIWSNRFADSSILKTLYSFIGEYLSEAYQGSIEKLASSSLTSTPLYRYKTWHHLPLYEIHRLEVSPVGSSGSYTIVYGLREEDFLLLNCSRIYYTPDSTTEYLQVNTDYSFFDKESHEIKGLEGTTGNTSFFSRFSRFIVFYSIDPIYDSGYVEKQKEIAAYPLIFRVNNHLLGVSIDAQKIGASVTLETSSYKTSAEILDIQELEEDTLIYLEPGCFTNSIDDGLVNITGLADQAITAQVYSSFTLEMQDINLWAYRCTLDEFSLFKKWAYILGPGEYDNPPIRSSEAYRLLLETMLECRMLGLTANRLSRLAGILAGSEALAFSSINDTLDKLDLQLNTLTSELTRYSLLPEASINFRIVENCQRIKIANSTISIGSCIFIKISDRSTFNLVYTKILSNRNTGISFTDTLGVVWGEAICACNDQRVVLRVVTQIPEEGESVQVYYSNSAHILLRPDSYEIINFAQDNNIGQDTLINPVAKVVDYFTGLTDYIGRGLYIPSSIWEVDSTFRREVVYERTPFVIGSMPRHRIGDYEFIIPTMDPSINYFDSPSTLNPEGYSWATSYKLLKDLLQTKIGLVTPIPSSLRGSFESTVSIVDSVKDISKSFFTLESVDVVDYLPTPQDTLEVFVERAIVDTAQVITYGGIGSLGLTLLVSGSFDISESDTVDQLTLQPPAALGSLPSESLPISLIGYEQGYALLDAGYTPGDLAEWLSSEYTLLLNVNGVSVSADLELATNYVGSSSRLMVVGASYPEYTQYYEFNDNTLSEWLQITTQPPPPPNELVEDAIVVSSNLEDPVELIPVTQNLEDSVPLPNDELPVPSEEV